MDTPALYRTRITHMRRAPAHHYFEHRSYSWYLDIDNLPRLPRWLRPFARFDARDHFDGVADDSLRQRIDAFLTTHGAAVPGGRITALLQARVLGYAFNPLTLYWCHDRNGVLRNVVAEVHNTRGEQHGYLLPRADSPVLAAKRLYASPFHPVDGHYLVRAPRPDRFLDIAVSLHRADEPAFVATMRGTRRRAVAAQVLWLQIAAPLAPLLARLDMGVQAAVLWLRGVPRVPWRPTVNGHIGIANAASHVDVTELPDPSVAS
ncbi:MAG: DUF1365 family protein [Mycobacteriaceae bacterium]|nr:DUF1365 family protein [Mycobacteriaceae bacterium]MBV9641359.1 DUF1365 family protein [Mycobacteriaceae bacterium]